VSELRQKLTLWFLRRFVAFRALKQRVELLSEPARVEREALEKGCSRRVEAEVLHALLLHLPCFIFVDVLPTQQVGWLGPGEIRVRIFEGGGPS
jgi:hypothetical protein